MIRSGVVALLILTSIGLQAQDGRLDKKISRIDQKYLSKDKYKKGIRKAKRLERKADDDVPGDLVKVNALLNKAYMLNGNVKQATETFEKMASNPAFTGQQAAEVFVRNGRYGLAAKQLGDSISLSGKILLHDCYIKQGEMLKAIALEKQISADVDLATSAKKKRARKAGYENAVRFNIQVAERLREQGLYDSSLARLYGIPKRQLRKLPGQSDLGAQFYEALAQTSMETGDIDAAENYYDEALDNHLKRHQMRHPHSIELLANCMQSYYLLGKDKKIKDKIREYYIDLDYYSSQRKSLNTIPLLLAEVERKAGDGSFRDADKTAKSLLRIAAAYDSTECLQVYKLCSNLYSYFIARDNFTDASACLEVMGRMTPTLFGPESPATAQQRLMEAQYRVNYQFDPSAITAFTDPLTWNLYADNYGTRHQKYMTYINCKAQAYGLVDKIDEQKGTLEESVKLTEQMYGQSLLWAKQLVILAEANLNAGNFPVVPEYLNRAMPIIADKEGKSSLTYLTASRVLAEFYENTGKLDEARDIYRKTFRRLDRLSRRGGVSSFSQPEKMAQVLMLVGDYAGAEKEISEAIEQKTKLYGERAPIVLIEPFVLSARLNYVQGHYIAAQEAAQKAIDIGKKLNMESSLKVQQAYKTMADVDYAIGDYRSAKTRLEKILEIQQRTLGRNNPLVAATLLKLSLAAYYSNGNVEMNKTRADEAASIMAQTLGANSLQLADAMVYQALFNLALGQADPALELLGNSEKIYAGQLKSGNREQARAVCIAGDALLAKNMLTEAEAKYKLSAESYRKLFGKSHPEYLKTQSKLARLKIKQGLNADAFTISQTLVNNYERFVDEVFPFLSEREKSKYWQQLKDDFDMYYSLVATVAPNDQKGLKKMLNSRVNTKALLLRSSVKFQKDVIAANDEAITDMFGQWLTTRRKIALSFSMSPEELLEAGVNIPDLESEAGKVEKQLRKKLYGKADSDDRDRVPALLKKVGPNGVLVEVIRYAQLGDKSKPGYAFLMADGATKKLSLVTLDKGEELETPYYRYYKNAIKLNAKDKYSYQGFWSKVDEKIQDGKSVYFSPDGVYGLMNIETFVDDAGKYVLEKNDVYVLNNPGDLLAASTRSIKPEDGAELVGDPSFYAQQDFVTKRLIKDLPGTGEEVISIDQVLKQKGINAGVLTRAFATEASIKRMFHPGIVHFATHGYFEEQDEVIANSLSEEETGKHPLLQSGLLLANSGELLENQSDQIYSRDGILTAFEAKDLDLNKTDLVVLSACETGLGKVSVGEGVYGLQRAFLDAGSNSVMMSLFKVNDGSTKELMESFYKHWMDSGNKKLALITAKKELKEKYNEPIKWGSFVLVGN